MHVSSMLSKVVMVQEYLLDLHTASNVLLGRMCCFALRVAKLPLSSPSIAFCTPF